jgi:glycosyltransferase involved in cell wall biosynthesis
MVGALRDWVAKAGLTDQIAIHGEYRLTDLSRLLDQADLVVLPSLWEGLPLVLIEAMSRGVPFVATAAGGSEELGDSNPDVKITGTDWPSFEAGLIEMAHRLRTGKTDPIRLHRWTEQRYGYESVSKRWLTCLHQPGLFFSA